jgi:uncharacterized protein
MNSLNFLDTNVWLALVWGRHSHSEAARDWFDQSEDEQFLFCRFTQLALLRLLTNKSVMGQDVKTTAAAWEIYDQCCADERIAFLAEPQGIDPKLRTFARSHKASPKLWADAYLAAFASAAGLRIVTFDRAFRSRPVECLVLE